MPRSSQESESEPLTLGQALAAHVRLIVWCKSCNHRAEPEVATQVAQHGAGMTVIDWARLLRCTECGERDRLSISKRVLLSCVNRKSSANKFDLGGPDAAQPLPR